MESRSRVQTDSKPHHALQKCLCVCLFYVLQVACMFVEGYTPQATQCVCFCDGKIECVCVRSLKGSTRKFSPLVFNPPENRTCVLTLYILFLRILPLNLERWWGPAHIWIAFHHALHPWSVAEFCCDVACGFTPLFAAIILTVAIAKISGWGCVMWQDSHACENSSREFHLPLRWRQLSILQCTRYVQTRYFGHSAYTSDE